MMTYVPAEISRRMAGSEEITVKTVLLNVAVIAPLFFVNYFGTTGNAAFFLALVLMMAKSTEHAVRALSLMYLVIVGNVALVDTSSTLFSAGKFLFLCLVAARLFYSLRLQGRMLHRIPVVGSLLLFCLVALLLALEGGYFAQVSALKLLSFLTGMVCVLASVEAMRHRRHGLNGWFLSIAIFVMLIGLVTWAAGLGFNSKTDLTYFNRFLNGPFYHPQTLGPASALIVLWLVGFGTLTRHRLRFVALPMIAVFLVFLYMSSARTSLLAIGLAMVVSVLLLAFMRGKALRQMLRLARHALLAGSAIGFVLTMVELIRPGTIVEPVLEFVLKRNSADLQLQAEVILYSRQSLIEMMTENIEQNPWTGIGFGTSTHSAFVNNASLLRATTEKGVLPIAIVEETGYIGALFFLVFLLSAFVYLIRSGNILGVVGLSAMLGINMAEMNFFSFGGHGGFFWAWVMALMLMRLDTTTLSAPSRLRSRPSQDFGVRTV